MRSDVRRDVQPLVLAGVILLAVVIVGYLLLQVIQIIAVLFLGLIISISLNPLVDFLARYRIPRVLAVLLVYLLIAGALLIFGYYAVREIGATDFNLQFEELKASYEDLSEGTGLPSSDEVVSSLRGLSSGLSGSVFSQTVSLLSGILYFFTILFAALLFTASQDRLKQIVLDFVPGEHHARAEELLAKLARGVRGFVTGEFIAMVTIGVVTYIGLLIVGVKIPLVLAFIAFITEILPLVGPWIAFIPAAAVALTDGPIKLLEVAVLYLLVQAFENYIVTPLVHGRESQVPALLIPTALLVGGSLMGILGALIALPLAVSLHILYFELVRPWARLHFSASRQIEVPGSSEGG